MYKPTIRIGIIESSEIVLEGIENLLLKGYSNVTIYTIKDLQDVTLFNVKNELDYIFINPVQIVNRVKIFKTLKAENPNLKWFGLVYSIFEKDLLSHFDELISIDDSKESIFRKIQKSQLRNELTTDDHPKEGLTDREISVLKEMIRGNSNKEIADILNISVHTVMSHRKNITQKTAIKSQAGLTVYALTNNIISIDSI